MSRYQAFMFFTTTIALTACGAEEEGSGTLAVEIWGEDFIEKGIPASEFSDGWSMVFDRFLVAVDGIAVARGNNTPNLQDEVQRIFNLTRPGPLSFLTREVPAGLYDRTDYTIRPASNYVIAGNASAEDVELMKDNRYSVYVEGTAKYNENSENSKIFKWGFDTTTSYVHCHSEADIENGDAETVQLTIHADHLFYDDLYAEEPALTFEIIAQADKDGDGEVTSAELSSFDLKALANYGTGSAYVDNLWEFISHLTHTLGHIDGEGHCDII